MKRKLLALLLLGIIVSVIAGCDSFTLPLYFPTMNTTTTRAVKTIDFSGTITIADADYQSYAEYRSLVYDFPVDAYNDVLINTRDKIRRANIWIQTTLYESRTLYPFGQANVIRSSSKGSGFIFKEDDEYYYAVTNFHVIDPLTYTPEYEILTFEDEDSYAAEVVAYDEAIDIAVIKFLKSDRTQVTMIDIVERSFTKLTPGELVLAVGNPLSVAYNVTFGEFISMQLISRADFSVVFHSAMIHEGSSGGALVDVDGNLLGINTWGSESSDEESFAIPVSILYMFLHNNDLLP